MILDPNGSSFDNDKAHAFWHSDTGQSVLKVIKAATKDSGSGDSSGGCDCYEVEETQKTLVPEQTVTTASAYNMIYASLADCVYDQSVVGNEATVVYNGVEYKCSPRINTNTYTTFVEFGGHRTYGNNGYSDDYSEYPFIILINENSGSVFTEEPRTVSIKATAPSSDVIPSDNFKRAVRNSPGLRLKRDNTFINGSQTELIYDSEAVVTDANGNITAVIDRDLFAQIPTDALFPVSSNANQIVLGYYNKNGQRSTITIPIASSTGDMQRSVYDKYGYVSRAGGIDDYVSGQLEGSGISDFRERIVGGNMPIEVDLASFRRITDWDELFVKGDRNNYWGELNPYNGWSSDPDAGDYVPLENVYISDVINYLSRNNKYNPGYSEKRLFDWSTYIKIVPYTPIDRLRMRQAGISEIYGFLNIEDTDTTFDYLNYPIRLYTFEEPTNLSSLVGDSIISLQVLYITPVIFGP